MKLRINGDELREVSEAEEFERRMIPQNMIPPSSQHIIESSELGDALHELNNDNIEPDNRMSGIDMRARLHPIEISSILAVDTLVGFKFLPKDILTFTRQKKRLSVSLKGEGRREIVDLVAGKKEQDSKQSSGFLSRVGDLFSKKEK